MGFVTSTPLHALVQRAVIVLMKQILVVRVGTLLDDQRGPFTRRETTKVSETLFSNDNVQVMFYIYSVPRYDANTHAENLTSLVHMRSERNDATDTSRVRLSWSTAESSVEY